MNVQLPIHLDKRAFFDWVRGREERYELLHGRVVRMIGASRAHGQIVTNLIVSLHDQLDPTQCSVVAEFGIEIGPDVLRYPDVVVDRADCDASDLTTKHPVLIAEVLSPSSVTVDLGDKPAEYLRLLPLNAYIVLTQDEPKAWVWVRGKSGFSGAPTVVAGRDVTIEVPPLGVSLPRNAIYAGIAES
ncbi:MAG: Uma2 family endonuclease [Xanthobacteraceae bacterium]|nr:Uma2 family endonuclease [Xanthobacteraceae bacterium]